MVAIKTCFETSLETCSVAKWQRFINQILILTPCTQISTSYFLRLRSGLLPPAQKQALVRLAVFHTNCTRIARLTAYEKPRHSCPINPPHLLLCARSKRNMDLCQDNWGLFLLSAQASFLLFRNPFVNLDDYTFSLKATTPGHGTRLRDGPSRKSPHI